MSKNVLVVEDDEGHRQTLTRHLSRSGWNVTAAESAESALSNFSAAEPDIVLTDIRMPGMDGLQLLDRLRENVSTPVVVMTAFGQMQPAIDAMKKGAFDFLVKPLDLDRLDEVLERCYVEAVKAGERESAEPKRAREAGLGALVGSDPHMVEIYKMIGAIAHTRAPVLIRGETGTGKELIARVIHSNAPQSNEPFLAINCTAVPENLLESELFGHMRGAFTGAVADRKGRFELAGSGTIFLDEIGDTPAQFQAKLLRVLQEREFYPVGSEKPRRTEARVIAATHRPVEQMIDEGTFREDLYFRLRVVEITIPPLRERRSDIPLLAEHFLRKAGREMGREFVLADETRATLLAYAWPGNVRELENALTRAAVLSRSDIISVDHLSLGGATDGGIPEYDVDSLEAVERAHVQRVLTETGGNKSKAAEKLKISRPRLDRIIERHGLVV